MATSQERINLIVPFAQKDKAKALGAKWDGNSKCWWIPANVDTAPFARWRPAQNNEQPLYQDLVPINREELLEHRTSDLLEVVFVPWTCWKCQQTTLAFHGSIERAICATHLFYQPRVLEELERIRKELELARFGCIKPRFSRTVGSAYVSQGCRHCDALIGEFPLSEDFSEVLSTLDLSTYRCCRVLDWSLLLGQQ
ncbi:DUF5710 domain-containing protein [Paracidobacterium acidisoli]|uniref:DUF5710 domain-containing protein n=1 Tax=Paracidobacterium acidisoli TaxID=2303751 RepID=UPI0011C0F191|nr:DUF5710 domain-containing protein [Paracidobacterium acidisoli]MBT9329537.1 hypothetical protein [Paracidobacterium acidisoli]